MAFHPFTQKGLNWMQFRLKKKELKEGEGLQTLQPLFYLLDVTIGVNSPLEGSKGMKDGRC